MGIVGITKTNELKRIIIEEASQNDWECESNDADAENGVQTMTIDVMGGDTETDAEW